MAGKFKHGEKVVLLPEGKLYDFGYMGATGKKIQRFQTRSSGVNR